MSKWIVDIHGEIEGDYDLICKAESIISLEKIKQAREEIENRSTYDGIYIDRAEVLEILDRLISEVKIC